MNKPLNSKVRGIFAARLKSLSNSYQLSFSEQCKAMNIPYQTMQKYLKAISDCSITNLSIIATYYHVSADYLLGRTENRTTDNNIRSICEYKGVFDGLYDYINRK